ncbi:MAG: type III restriction endonuclease subunit R, partial [Firmicutes bacterium]|nr:type III restriction endonuclease subunit R [Bacillota bacterium]
PRIPRVATYEQFAAFAAAGRRLADLHVNFERQPEWPARVRLGEGVIGDDLYTIGKIRYAKIPGKKGAAAWDKTTIIYNDHITIEGVPPEAQEYVVNKRSALDWILEKAEYKVDRDSGIVNDFNQYGLEMTPPNARYPLELLLKVITVSVETVKIVRSLPPLEIHQADL